MAKSVDIIGRALSGEWGEDDTSGDGIPVLRTTNFTNDGIVNYENVVTRNITKKKLDDKYLRPGDIIIEKSGGSDKQPVGRVIYFEGPENTYLFNNFTGLLRIRDFSHWCPKYVFYALFFNCLTNRQRIQEEVFGEYTITLPPMEIQEQFAAFVEQTDKSKLYGAMEVAA